MRTHECGLGPEPTTGYNGSLGVFHARLLVWHRQLEDGCCEEKHFMSVFGQRCILYETPKSWAKKPKEEQYCTDSEIGFHLTMAFHDSLWFRGTLHEVG